MSTLHLRQRLIDIAKRDVGKVEISHNRAPFIAKYWSATDIPNGMQLRYPYCSSFVAYCMREWLKDKEVLAQLQLTPETAERWRGKTAGAFVWGNTWAPGKIAAYEKEKKLRENPSYKPSPSSVQAQTFVANGQVLVINEKRDRLEGKPRQRLRLGDLIILDVSHIGIVISDSANIVSTVEGNTGANGSREGDGVWLKQRDRKDVRCFVRLMDP
jgi:hypothetical protein